MSTRNYLKTTVFAALAAASMVAATAQSASAQKVVAATCPDGYVLSGSRCLKSGPTPACPSGYAFSSGKCTATRTGNSSSGGQWAFVTREAFGVKSAKEVDGANFCAVTGSPAADAAGDFFKDNGLTATHIEVKDDRKAIETYQKYDCDLLVVAERGADATANSLEPKGDHLVLPEAFGTGAPVEQAEPPATVKTPPVPVETAPVKTAPAPVKTTPVQQASHKPVNKPRCSAVKYGFTRGNTCGCAGGRVFTGSQCVRRRH